MFVGLQENTLVQDNANPIEKIERSSLIVCVQAPPPRRAAASQSSCRASVKNMPDLWGSTLSICLHELSYPEVPGVRVLRIVRLGVDLNRRYELDPAGSKMPRVADPRAPRGTAHT